MVRLIIAVIVGTGIGYGARPVATDDAGTVAAGGYELETGCDFWSDWAEADIGFKHGLSQRMDIGIGFGIIITPEEPERFGLLEIGLKFALIPDLFAISVASEFGTSSYSLNGVITRTFGPLELDLNLGYAATGMSNEEGTITYAGALILGLDRIDIGAESSGDKDGFQTWLSGFRYHLVAGFALDCGISGGFEEDSEFTATGGIHYEF